MSNNKNNTFIDYKYICIKKDKFDVNVINLNYNNIENNNIEIIYKSPSIILDGIFLKTSPISGNIISIYHKEKYTNNITIKLMLNKKEHQQFIEIMKSIDEHLSKNINNFINTMETSIDVNNFNNINNINNINNFNNFNNINNVKNLSSLRYEQIIKYKHNYNYTENTGNNDENYQIYLKSYLDKNIISELEKKLNKKYIFTFNISNIYLSTNSLIPLIKCNYCEIVN